MALATIRLARDGFLGYHRYTTIRTNRAHLFVVTEDTVRYMKMVIAGQPDFLVNQREWAMCFVPKGKEEGLSFAFQDSYGTADLDAVR
jgi:hypothetical protein